MEWPGFEPQTSSIRRGRSIHSTTRHLALSRQNETNFTLYCFTIAISLCKTPSFNLCRYIVFRVYEFLSVVGCGCGVSPTDSSRDSPESSCGTVTTAPPHCLRRRLRTRKKQQVRSKLTKYFLACFESTLSFQNLLCATFDLTMQVILIIHYGDLLRQVLEVCQCLMCLVVRAIDWQRVTKNSLSITKNILTTFNIMNNPSTVREPAATTLYVWKQKEANSKSTVDWAYLS